MSFHFLRGPSTHLGLGWKESEDLLKAADNEFAGYPRGECLGFTVQRIRDKVLSIPLLPSAGTERGPLHITR